MCVFGIHPLMLIQFIVVLGGGFGVDTNKGEYHLGGCHPWEPEHKTTK